MTLLSNGKEHGVYNMNEIISDMELTRKFCSMIHKARQNNGFNSVKYPITNVIISEYLMPDFRQLIADECNVVGYMDIPAVEYDFEKPTFSEYEILEDSELWIAMSTTKSDWQEKMYQERLEKRNDMLSK